MNANDAFGEVPPSAAAHISMDPDRFRRTEIMVMVLMMMSGVVGCCRGRRAVTMNRKNFVSHFAYFEIQI
jgi:hypothetical protein